jgi:hypothetical protein
VYSLRQAKQDIDSIYSTGLFEDVNIVPQEAEDSTEQQPKVWQQHLAQPAAACAAAAAALHVCGCAVVGLHITAHLCRPKARRADWMNACLSAGAC